MFINAVLHRRSRAYRFRRGTNSGGGTGYRAQLPAATAEPSEGLPTLADLADSRATFEKANEAYLEWASPGRPAPEAFEKYQPVLEAKEVYERNLGLWCQRFQVVLPHIKMVRGNDDKGSSPVVRRMIRDVSGSGAAHPLANAGLLGPEPAQAVEMLRVVDEALTESLKHRSGLALLQDEFWLDQ